MRPIVLGLVLFGCATARPSAVDVVEREVAAYNYDRLTMRCATSRTTLSLKNLNAASRARARRVKYARQRMDLCGRLADGGGDVTEGRLKRLSLYLSVNRGHS